MAVIGYFASEYPSISHTFIRREIAALRRRGLEIRTFSIRRAPEAAPLGAKDRREEGETRYLLPAGLVSIASAHVRELVRNPLRYAQAFFVALRNRPPGARALLWSLFYFAEGALLADALHREDVRHLHVHFARSEEDVATILADSEVLVLASLLEGLPVVLMEAMSFGLPVVAPNVAGIPELVGHEREGLLFRASDWADLSAQLRRVVTDAELRARLGAAGRTRVSGEFAIDRAVEPLWKRFSSDGAA